MNKKKIGELDGTPIVTGKKNYANEHEYYLTMNEDNTYQKLELRVSGDLFRLVLGGGGNDYPTPTASDVNKVWQVTPVLKETKTEETVIVPEQTCQMEDEGKQTKCTLQNVDESFVPGFSGIVILDGVEYEIEWEETTSGFTINGDCAIEYSEHENKYYLVDANKGLTHTIKVITRETEPVYDYNWAPGVKIPIPTAEDEGKILVVTKTEGNSSIIVPEQPVPADNNTPLTDVDLNKFVVGNTVKVTISENSETFTATGVLEQRLDMTGVSFYIQELDGWFSIAKTENSLITDAFDLGLSNSTIKLEYIESNYEYQLQENSGGGSNILYCEGSDDTHGTITAYIDSSELYNPQITTIAVDTGEETFYFYRMGSDGWLISGFDTFDHSDEWIKVWNTSSQYPTIVAYYTSR